MARSFASASTQYLTNANAVLTGHPMTLACWYNATTLGSEVWLIFDGASGNDHFSLAIDSTALYAHIQAGGAGSLATSTIAPSTSTWQHGTAVFTSTTSRTIYLNGANNATNTDSRSPAAASRTDIAARAGGLTFNGQIAEAAIWNVALSAADALILSLGYSPLLVRPDALQAYWPLVGRFSPETDPVGKFDMTLTNTPTTTAHTRVFYPPIPQLSHPAAAAAGQPTMRRWGGVPGMLGAGRQGQGRSW